MNIKHSGWFALLVFGLLVGAYGVIFEANMSLAAWNLIRFAAVFIVVVAVAGHIERAGREPTELSWGRKSKEHDSQSSNATVMPAAVVGAPLASEATEKPVSAILKDVTPGFMNGYSWYDYPQALD